MARLRREVADDRDRRIALRAAAQEGEHRLRVVVDDDPAEALRLAVARMERRRLAIEAVEVADQRLHALMRPMVEQPPGQRSLAFHSLVWPNSWPMNRSFLPGWPHMKP